MPPLAQTVPPFAKEFSSSNPLLHSVAELVFHDAQRLREQAKRQRKEIDSSNTLDKRWLEALLSVKFIEFVNYRRDKSLVQFFGFRNGCGFWNRQLSDDKQ